MGNSTCSKPAKLKEQKSNKIQSNLCLMSMQDSTFDKSFQFNHSEYHQKLDHLMDQEIVIKLKKGINVKTLLRSENFYDAFSLIEASRYIYNKLMDQRNVLSKNEIYGEGMNFLFQLMEDLLHFEMLRLSSIKVSEISNKYFPYILFSSIFTIYHALNAYQNFKIMRVQDIWWNKIKPEDGLYSLVSYIILIIGKIRYEFDVKINKNSKPVNLKNSIRSGTVHETIMSVDISPICKRLRQYSNFEAAFLYSLKFHKNRPRLDSIEEIENNLENLLGENDSIEEITTPIHKNIDKYAVFETEFIAQKIEKSNISRQLYENNEMKSKKNNSSELKNVKLIESIIYKKEESESENHKIEPISDIIMKNIERILKKYKNIKPIDENEENINQYIEKIK